MRLFLFFVFVLLGLVQCRYHDHGKRSDNVAFVEGRQTHHSVEFLQRTENKKDQEDKEKEETDGVKEETGPVDKKDSKDTTAKTTEESDCKVYCDKKPEETLKEKAKDCKCSSGCMARVSVVVMAALIAFVLDRN